MIVIWPSVYIHPYGIYDPRTRTIQESDGILQKQSRSAKSQVRLKYHHSEKRSKLTDEAFFGWKSKGIREILGVLTDAAFFGWKSKGIQETVRVLIYDCHLAICVYPPLWNL